MRITFQICNYMYKIVHGLAPEYLNCAIVRNAPILAFRWGSVTDATLVAVMESKEESNRIGEWRNTCPRDGVKKRIESDRRVTQHLSPWWSQKKNRIGSASDATFVPVMESKKESNRIGEWRNTYRRDGVKRRIESDRRVTQRLSPWWSQKKNRIGSTSDATLVAVMESKEESNRISEGCKLVAVMESKEESNRIGEWRNSCRRDGVKRRIESDRRVTQQLSPWWSQKKNRIGSASDATLFAVMESKEESNRIGEWRNSCRRDGVKRRIESDRRVTQHFSPWWSQKKNRIDRRVTQHLTPWWSQREESIGRGNFAAQAQLCGVVCQSVLTFRNN